MYQEKNTIETMMPSMKTYFASSLFCLLITSAFADPVITLQFNNQSKYQILNAYAGQHCIHNGANGGGNDNGSNGKYHALNPGEKNTVRISKDSGYGCDGITSWDKFTMQSADKKDPVINCELKITKDPNSSSLYCNKIYSSRLIYDDARKDYQHYYITILNRPSS